ncbi:ergothioneine biosynthesis glutamate--cysteine ligase EgtA [Angustibacter luteus]|uniref:Glutamate--cysteine ligase EgtA n=1 Tax=Angustibacter luteus TaxID=658456 RepID=A0ABW1JIU7_9ACTN
MATEGLLGDAGPQVEPDADQDEDARRPLSVDAAHAYVAAGALRAGSPGPVGLELEAHVVDLAEPSRRPSWAHLHAALDSVPRLPGGSVVTLEPGGQVELSGPPGAGVGEAVAGVAVDHAALRRHLATHGLGLALVGADPLREAARVNPGQRYDAMEQHWRATGQASAGLSMMCSTASLQVNLEAGPTHEWARRTELVHLLGPVLVAVSACSPWLSGRATGWRSTRQRVWGDLDVLRCGPLRGGPDPAAEWADYALDAPVMLVRSGDRVDPVRTRIPLREWLSGAVRLGDRLPERSDVDLHLTTLFPPARLRGFIEVRYLDAVPRRWWGALAATLVTLMDVPQAADLAAAAAEPVGREWTAAARDGLTHPGLAVAARACLAAAAAHAPAALADQVGELADLVATGRSPGDDVADTAARFGPEAALLAACPPAYEGEDADA